ncbi:ester cyclase [soil metagenome]
MTSEQNKMTVRRMFEEIINQEQPAVIDEIFAQAVVVHDPLMGAHTGIDTFRQLLGVFDTAFPGHRVQIDEMVAEGDFVSVLHTHTATHTGLFMGMPPTGKQAIVGGMELFRVVNGKIVEFWRKDDDVSLLMQLGAIPAPQPA